MQNVIRVLVKELIVVSPREYVAEGIIVPIDVNANDRYRVKSYVPRACHFPQLKNTG